MKTDGLEMVIVPNNRFLEWFKHMKAIVGEMDLKINDDVLDEMSKMPNCNGELYSK